MITPVKLSLLEAVFDVLHMRGIRYGLGAKIPLTWDSHDARIHRVDCSGLFRYLIAKSTNQQVVPPDGSWNQKDWCEAEGLRRVHYQDLPMADKSRLFAAFITPHENGAGAIGHVWLINKLDADAIPDTLESHGGVGVNSRPWNARTLWRQVSACFEIPTM